MHWYSLRVISGKEKSAEEHILREADNNKITNEIEEVFVPYEKVVEILFKTGDAIKVVAGPFIDFTGFVESVNADKQKVKVTVSIFGRPTPIELDFFQIEVEK